MAVKNILFKKGDTGWKIKRGQYITATDMSALFGFNQYTSPAKMLKNKTDPSFVDNEFTRMGRWMEPCVLEAVEEILDEEVNLFAPRRHNNIYYDENTRIAATPDAFIGKGLDEIEYVVELKSTNESKLRKWIQDPPLGYLVQLATQCMLTGCNQGYLAVMGVLYPTMPLAIFKFTGTEECYSLLQDEVLRFRQAIDRDQSLRLNTKARDMMSSILLKNTTLFYKHGIETLVFEKVDW